MAATHPLDDFLRQIKYHFDYLFNQYGFQVIAAEGDYPGFIILESAQCRIKFYRMDGEVNLLLGTRQAPIGWPVEIDGIKQWYYIREVLNFVEKRVPALEDIYKEIAAHRTEEEQMAGLSYQLKPVCDQVLYLFEIDNFSRQRLALDAFSRKVAETIANALRHKS